MAKEKVFVVRSLKSDANVPTVTRLVRAKREAQVASHVLQDWSIAVATTDDVIEATKAGIEVEDAGE